VSQSDADGPGRRHRGHHVLDLEADHAAAGDRHSDSGDALLDLALRGDQVAVVDVDDAAALRAVLLHQRQRAVQRKEGDVAAGVLGHGGDDRVGRVQHGHAAGATFCTITRLSTARSSSVVM
jgi:hypothetical protein